MWRRLIDAIGGAQRREAVLTASVEAERAEQLLARERIIGMARVDRQPVEADPPLLTYGQEHGYRPPRRA